MYQRLVSWMRPRPFVDKQTGHRETFPQPAPSVAFLPLRNAMPAIVGWGSHGRLRSVRHFAHARQHAGQRT